MKKCIKYLLILICLLATLSAWGEARGGGRRGGSFGGIFGGWRKYKKQSSSGNSRRTTNGSPMHSTVVASSGDSGLSKQSKFQSSYPKQNLPTGFTAMTSNYNPLGYTRPVPPGGTYYAHKATLPPGAVLYRDAPAYSKDSNSLIFGLITGHVLMQGMTGMRSMDEYKRYAAYNEQLRNNATANNKVIIINNGAENSEVPSGRQENATAEDTNSTSTTSSVTLSSKTDFEENITQALSNATPPTEPIVIAPEGGIICLPLMLSEADPQDPSATVSIVRTICYPAPPPQALPLPTTGTGCRSAAGDGVEGHNDCGPTTSTQPTVIAGDIADYPDEMR